MIIAPSLALGLALGLSAEAPEPSRGCVHLEFSLTGNDGPRLAELAGAPSCGPLKPVVSGTPTYDRQRAVLRVPVALRNEGTTRLRAPARLYGWTDSLVVVEAIGLAAAPAGTYAWVLGADTALAAGSMAVTVPLRGAVAWRFDALLVAGAEASTQTLAPGATSGVRWIELAVHQGVRRMRLAFWAEARPARAPVPPVPPDSVPKAVWDSLLAPGNVLVDAPSLPGSVVRNALRVAFKPEATTEDKEDLLQLIDGEVIGGTPAPLRFYVIRFAYPTLASGDSTSGHFLRTLIRVERHPALRRVLFIEAENPYRSIHIRRADRTGVQKPRLHPVPATAPDTLPTALIESLPYVTDERRPDLRYRRDLLLLEFEPGTSQADRERAVALVDGEVIGGEASVMAGEEGWYLLRFDGPSIDAIHAAIAALRALPFVSVAVPVSVSERSAYLRPTDGTGWREWQVKSAETNACRPHWALDATTDLCRRAVRRKLLLDACAA